ncbi:aspartate/glutamate racemase family protein [Mucilaginibacter gynuensis]|uniref:Aspartate/glutamate racemase family protein n=1 Tax=Mucilaginibacter gynuensis TaxID=1302236 RepID=A0ABP8G1Z8_9SPHI
MKIIGLIGGMSWESSALYYRHINKMVHQQLGGIHSAQIQMHSVDYDPIVEMGRVGNWQGVADITTDIAVKLEASGAECILICCNTVHRIADEVEQKISIPLIHIADVTGEAIQKAGLTKIALLGTKFTMEGDFFKSRILQKFGIDTIVPNDADRDYLHDAIRNEFCNGIFSDSTKQHIITIINKMVSEGAQGVILGCTELPILISPEDCSIPVFDTTLIHSQAAVKFSLEELAVV